MLETSARLLKLLSLLQTAREWTGAELAERLDVTGRTVRNDVERLRRLGYPVHATRGAAGGYRLGAGSRLPPLLLDDEEAVAVAVAVGLGTATDGSVTGIEDSSQRALAKLEQVLPPRLRRRVSALRGHTVPVRPRRQGTGVPPEVLTAIAAACRDHERLRFDYLGHDGSGGRRDVEPYRLVSWGRRWYLVAWDTGRGDWRTFRVDRLTPVTPGGPRFTPRPLPDEDVAAYVSRGVATAPWAFRARVTVHAPAAAVAERLPATAGTVEPLDEHSCTVVTGADSPETLAAWLGVLGLDFDASGSPELAAALRSVADRCLRAAGEAS